MKGKDWGTGHANTRLSPPSLISDVLWGRTHCKSRTHREVWQTRKTGKKDKHGRDIRKAVGKPTKEVVWHVSSLDPDSRTAKQFSEIVRTHWYVEVYHGKRDNGYHEDAFTRRCDVNVMAAMMVARSFGMWICARHPERTTEQVKDDLYLHPAKLVRIMMKGGLQ